MASCSSSGSDDGGKKKAREVLEHYFPSGVKFPRPLENCGQEFAVRSRYRAECSGLSVGPGGKEEQGVGETADPNVWGFLPDDLHARVLEKLPFPSLVRFRIVCKRWNAIVLSEGFNFSKLDRRRKCVPLYFHEDVPSIVYNKKRNSWQEISFSFLETPLNLLSLLVSAGGLLCFKTGIAGELLICNPVKKLSRRLQVPCRILHDSISVVPDGVETVFQNTSFCISRLKVCQVSTLDKDGVVGMYMDREGRNFKLVVAGVTYSGGTKERGTLVYDSSRNSWRRGGDVPKGLRFWRTGKPVASNGYVYFIGCDNGWLDEYGPAVFYCDLMRRLQNLRPWFVARYDIENSDWLIIPVAGLRGVLFQLVEYKGRILIVQRQTIDQTQVFASVLREDGRVTPLLSSRMPVELFPDTLDVLVGDWCVGQGDQFYVAGVYPENDNYAFNETGFYHPRMEGDKWLGFGVLTHNPVNKTWTQLPDLCGKYYPEGLYAFEPSLADV